MIEKITEQIGKLTLVANRDGQVVGAPHRSSVGQWLKPGKPDEAKPDKPFFCEIGDPHQLEAHLILDQADIHLIKPDSAAWLKIYGKAETTYKSQVSEIAKRSQRRSPHRALQHGRGRGRLQARPQDRRGQAADRRLRVIIPVDNPDLSSSPACAASPRSTAAPTRWPGGCCGGGTRSSTSSSDLSLWRLLVNATPTRVRQSSLATCHFRKQRLDAGHDARVVGAPIRMTFFSRANGLQAKLSRALPGPG